MLKEIFKLITQKKMKHYYIFLKPDPQFTPTAKIKDQADDFVEKLRDWYGKNEARIEAQSIFLHVWYPYRSDVFLEFRAPNKSPDIYFQGTRDDIKEIKSLYGAHIEEIQEHIPKGRVFGGGKFKKLQK